MLRDSSDISYVLAVHEVNAVIPASEEIDPVIEDWLISPSCRDTWRQITQPAGYRQANP
jgi:hypothetical protein